MEKIKALFFEETLKHWHFEEIVKASRLSRERVNYFLKQLLKNELIIKVKPKVKMPYYIANREDARFRSEKRFYGLILIEKAGLFQHLNTLKEVKTAILFGSFSRGDWNKSSNIDLFIYGDAKDFDMIKFEKILKREVQLFEYSNASLIKKELDAKLLPNIAKGFNIKGSLEPFEVTINT